MPNTNLERADLKTIFYIKNSILNAPNSLFTPLKIKQVYIPDKIIFHIFLVRNNHVCHITIHTKSMEI